MDQKELICFLRVILMMAHYCNYLPILVLIMVLPRVTEVTLYVTRCFWMDWLRNKIMNNWKKTSLWIRRWISYRDCRNESWLWLVTRVAWAVSEALNSEKQFQVLIESAMEILIRLRVLSCYMKMTSPNVSRLPATELFNWFVSIKILY